ALLASRRPRLQHLAARGNRKAQATLQLLEDPNTFLSTVQIGVTLVGVLAGAFGGATIAEQIAAALEDHPWLGPYSESIGLALVVLGITYLSLVVGELVPKRIALNAPERIATAMTRPMQFFSRLASPAVSLLGTSTNALLWLFRVKPKNDSPVTEDDVRAMIHHGAQTGIFHRAEQELVERVFQLADRRITDFMTPRHDVVWIDAGEPMSQVLNEIKNEPHSRYPVCDGELDKILGILHVRDLILLAGERLSGSFRDFLRKPLVAHEGMSALTVLERFKSSTTHFAIVVDEYGSVQGVVSDSDLLEAIVGDMPSHSAEEPYIVQRDASSWLVDGGAPIADLKKAVGIEDLPGEDTGAYHTAAGFVIQQLDRIPVVADQFTWKNLVFEVVDMDGNRVDKLLVRRIPVPMDTPES
ncbi:MAG: hemolysin family protein, partial [Candidatus Korobacteraceae bacterium]